MIRRKEKVHLIQVKVNTEELNWFKEYCRKKDRHMCQLVRQYIRDLKEAEEKNDIV